jgi:hypothetical protein
MRLAPRHLAPRHWAPGMATFLNPLSRRDPPAMAGQILEGRSPSRTKRGWRPVTGRPEAALFSIASAGGIPRRCPPRSLMAQIPGTNHSQPLPLAMAPRHWAPRTATFLDRLSRSHPRTMAAQALDAANHEHNPFAAAPDWHGTSSLRAENGHFSQSCQPEASTSVGRPSIRCSKSRAQSVCCRSRFEWRPLTGHPERPLFSIP